MLPTSSVASTALATAIATYSHVKPSQSRKPRGSRANRTLPSPSPVIDDDEVWLDAAGPLQTHGGLSDSSGYLESIIIRSLSSEFGEGMVTVRWRVRDRNFRIGAATHRSGASFASKSTYIRNTSVSTSPSPPVLIITVRSDRLAGYRLEDQHRVVWDALLNGLRYHLGRSSGFIQNNSQLELPTPVLTSHRHYRTCGLHVHELPEHQSLPVGIVAEVHTTAPGSSSIRQSLSPSLLTAGSLPAGSQAAYARLVERQDAAARALQAVYRAHLSHTLRRSCLRQHRAATTLSRVYRGHLGRRFARVLRKGLTMFAIGCQRIVRGWMGRQCVYDRRIRYTSASLCIQRVFRGWKGRVLAKFIRANWMKIVLAQSVCRMYLGKLVAARLRQIKIHREVILPGVQRMQALWRGIRAREHIQSNVIRPAGAVTIQRMFRGFLARRQKKILLRRKVSARRIQALVRGVQARQAVSRLRWFNQQILAATRIQASFRRHVCVQLFAIKQRRVFQARVMHPAATRIAMWFRRAIRTHKRQLLSVQKAAALRIQRAYRRQKAIRLWRFNTKEIAAVRLQAFARRVIAKRAARLLRIEELGARIDATRKLQAWWRGVSARSRYSVDIDTWRIKHVKDQLDDWNMMTLSLIVQVKANAVDCKAQSKLLKHASKRIQEAKREQRERRDRLIQIQQERAEVTLDDVRHGWGEALETEAYIKSREVEMCEEELVGKKLQCAEFQEALFDLRLESDEIYMELDRSKCEMACLHEYLHRTELRMANHRRKWDIATAVSKQRRRWAVKKTEHRRARKSDSDAGRLPSREAMRLGAGDPSSVNTNSAMISAGWDWRAAKERIIASATSDAHPVRSSLRDLVGTPLPQPYGPLLESMRKIANGMERPALGAVKQLVQAPVSHILKPLSPGPARIAQVL